MFISMYLSIYLQLSVLHNIIKILLEINIYYLCLKEYKISVIKPGFGKLLIKIMEDLKMTLLLQMHTKKWPIVSLDTFLTKKIISDN